MKSYRSAVILVVILGLLFGAYMFISKKKGTDNTKVEDSKIIKILELNKENIAEMTIENKGGKLVFSKKDKDWLLTLPANIKFDKNKIETIVANASSITSEKLVEENASDLAQYGLDAPALITLKMADGSVSTLQIGNQTPTKDDYYVKMKDSNKVYTLSQYAVETINVTKNDIRDNKLFTFSKPDEIIGFSMEKAGNTVFTTKKQSETEWTLTSPIEGNADAMKLPEIFQKVQGTSIVSYIEDNPSDLGKYGLKNPAYALEVETAAGKTKLLLGDEKEKGTEIYAKYANSQEVFVVTERELDFLDKPLKEIMYSFVYLVNIDQVNKIVVDMDGKTDTSDIQTDKDNKENDKFYINGKLTQGIKVGENSADSLFRTYYQKLIGITLDELDIDAKPTGKPEITFTYSLNTNPGTVKIEFIKKNDKYYYALNNGKYTKILVKKEQIDSLREAYKNLIDAVNSKN